MISIFSEGSDKHVYVRSHTRAPTARICKVNSDTNNIYNPTGYMQSKLRHK